MQYIRCELSIHCARSWSTSFRNLRYVLSDVDDLGFSVICFLQSNVEHHKNYVTSIPSSNPRDIFANDEIR